MNLFGIISTLVNVALLGRLIYLHFSKKYTLGRFRFYALATIASSIAALISLMGTSIGDFFVVLGPPDNPVYIGALAGHTDFRCVLVGLFLICVEVVVIVYFHDSWCKQLKKSNEAAGNGEADKEGKTQKKGFLVDIRIRFWRD